MIEPLDPDTLADTVYEVGLSDDPLVTVQRSAVAALLGVARDHARLTAALEEVARVHVPMPGKDPSLCGWCGVLSPCFSRRTARAALSAETGDTDG
jgi:hypothetical protein